MNSVRSLTKRRRLKKGRKFGDENEKLKRKIRKRERGHDWLAAKCAGKLKKLFCVLTFRRNKKRLVNLHTWESVKHGLFEIVFYTTTITLILCLFYMTRFSVSPLSNNHVTWFPTLPFLVGIFNICLFFFLVIMEVKKTHFLYPKLINF